MVTIKQLPTFVRIRDALIKADKSIVQLSKELRMKRSTLNYYLKELGKKGFLEKKRIESKERGRPTLLHFNKEKYEEYAKKLETYFKEEERKMLEHPLTLKVLKFIKENPNPSLKETNEEFPNAYSIASHLQWLMSKGLIINRFVITEEGKKFLKEHEI